MPLVCTGAEFIVPQLSSSKFVHIAKADGVVVDVKQNETMTVKYSNGKEEVLDILPRKSQTRRGAFISLEMESLPTGAKFKKNEILAGTKNFKLKENSYASGKNIKIAVMSYLGYSYEDAYVCSESFCQETTTDTMKEISIIVPPETKVFKLEKQFNKNTEPGETLVECAYQEDIDSYLMANDLDIDGDEVETILGSTNQSIMLKSPGGEIIDIKVYINDKLKSDPQLITFHKELTKRVEAIRKKLSFGKTDAFEVMTASDNIDSKFFKIGGHKQKGNEFRGVKIVYLIKTPKRLRVGDKIAPRYGAKGLIGKIYKDGTATAARSGNIDIFISPTSVLGRKNVSFIKELYLGKLTYTLRNRIKEMCNTPTVKTEEIIKYILDYYKLTGSKNTIESIEKKLTKLPLPSVRKYLQNGTMELYTILEPFHSVSFENIKSAAKMLKVPLDEKLTIIDENGKKITTDRPVPVGITYIQALEHFSSAYASVGGAVKWNSITKQPIKVGSSGNVSSVGQLDISAFITYDIDDVIHELLTARSDNHKLKRNMYSAISETGELYEPTEDDIKLQVTTGGTSDLKNIYFNALGLITR